MNRNQANLRREIEFEMNGVAVELDQTRILSDVSISASTGDCVVISGSNGSGKSTLLNAIAGLTIVERGEISLNCHNITNMQPHRLRKMGVVTSLQGGRIFPSLNIEENMVVASRKPRPDNGSFWNCMNGLDENKKAGTLSGGQRQRLSLELALQQPGNIFLLDEPFAGFDPIYLQQAIFDLSRWHRATNAILLIAEHRTAPIMQIATQFHQIRDNTLTCLWTEART